LAYLPKLYAVSVRRNPSNHLENPFFDFFFANTWSLEARYLKSLLFERNRAYSKYIEASVREIDGSQTHRQKPILADLEQGAQQDERLKTNKMKKL
jgi:hypothetical protein